MTEFKDADIQESIKSGLMAYKKLAKERLKLAWKKLPLKEQVAAARALVVMERAAKNPKAYFSREATWADWSARAKQYAAEHGIKEVFQAFYIVPSPVVLVADATEDALWYPVSSKYYWFLEDIQKYEYSEKQWEKERCAEKVLLDSKEVCKKLEALESGPVNKTLKDISCKFVR